MKRLGCIIIVSFLLVPQAFSGTIDSLSNLLKNARSDSAKISMHLLLATELMELDEKDALIHIKQAVGLAESYGNATFIAISYDHLGQYNKRHSQTDLAVIHFERAAENYSKSGNFKRKADALTEIGTVYANTGSRKKALAIFFEVLAYREALQDSLGMAIVYDKIGSVFKSMNRYDLAEKNYRESLSIFKTLQLELNVAEVLYNIGVLFNDKQEFTVALGYLEQAERILEENGEIWSLGMTYSHLGLVLNNLQRYEEAKDYLNKAEVLHFDLGDRTGFLFNNYVRATSLIALREYDRAISISNSILEEAKELGYSKVEEGTYYNLYKAYEGKRNYQSSLQYYQIYTALKDSTSYIDDLETVEQIQKSYNPNAKKTEIQESRLEASETKKFWEQDWFILGLFFLLLISLIITIERTTSFSRKANLYKYRNITYLRPARVLMLTGAILYIAVPLAMTNTVIPYDPFWLRFIISIGIIAAYWSTFYLDYAKVNVERIIKFLYAIMIAHNFFLVYRNDFLMVHVVYMLIILAALPAVYKTLRSIVIFGSFITAMSIIIGMGSQGGEVSPAMFVAAIASIIVISAVALMVRLEVNKQLELSNEVVNQVDVLMFIVNKNGENIYTSESVKSLLGYQPEELYSANWIETLGLNPSEAQKIKKNLIGIADGTLEPRGMEYQRFVTKSDDEKWFSIKEKQIDQERVLIIGLDVTERKLALDGLVKSERNFRQMNETLSDVFYLYNILDEKYEYISPNSGAIVGAEPDFFYEGNDHVESFVFEKDQELVRNAKKLIGKGKTYEIEYRVRVNGEIRWVKEKSYPVKDEEGRTFKNTGICQDITEKKRTENEIRKLSLIASHTSNYVIIAHADMGIEWVNEAFTKSFGYTLKEVRGKYPSSLLHDASTQNGVIDEINDKLFSKGEKFKGELFQRTKSGKGIYSRVDITPLFDRYGKVEKYFVLGVDISERKQYEEEIKKVADQLEILRAIENKILSSESTEEIIYNTLEAAIDKLPVLRSSFVLFNVNDRTFKSYVRRADNQSSFADKREFRLEDFELYETLNEKRTYHLHDLSQKEKFSITDEIVINEGGKLVLLSPLISDDILIGSFNVCFTDILEENVEHYIEVTNEVANGLAIAIQQSQLKEQIHRSNEAVLSSIEYAKMIQQAYIPDDLVIEGHLKESVIINRPKDVVSGDFYWMGKSGKTLVIAVGDCTGHGVPGAFMTIIGISELSSIVKHGAVTNPAEILNRLNKAVVKSLSSSTKDVQLKDGMDIGLCCYNTETRVMTYAGARRPLYYAYDSELHMAPGTRLSIGEKKPDFDIQYTNTVIPTNEIDAFYLFSDGCTDQFGGDRRRKFGRLRFEELLSDSIDLPLTQQKQMIERALEEWQGELYQTDDILFVGFKID